jgi:hypothetical protein
MNHSQTTLVETSKTPAARSGRPARWQFSLRELLLLTTTIAAIVALAALYFHRAAAFQESVVPERVCDIAWIRAACQKLGYPPPSSSRQMVELAQRDGGQWRSEFIIAIPLGQRGAFIDELQRELFAMERSFALDQCTARGRGDAGGMSEFHHSYRKGPIAGSVWVVSGDDPEGVRLSILVEEHAAVR